MFIFSVSLSIVQIMRDTRLFCLQDRQKLQVLPIWFFRFFAFYIVKNLTYEQLFIWTTIHMFSYNIWHYVQKYILNLCNITNTEILHLSDLMHHIAPILSPTTLYNTILYHVLYIMLSYTIHHITIYLSCIIHIAITYLSYIIYLIISLYHETHFLYCYTWNIILILLNNNHNTTSKNK